MGVSKHWKNWEVTPDKFEYNTIIHHTTKKKHTNDIPSKGHGLHFYSFRAHDFPSSIVEADRGNASLCSTSGQRQPLVSPKQSPGCAMVVRGSSHYGLLETMGSFINHVDS